MKKLPEKWFVNVTDENIVILDKWIGKHNYNLGKWSCVHFDKRACDKSNYLTLRDYTEISFSDFERLILKKKVNYEIYW